MTEEYDTNKENVRKHLKGWIVLLVFLLLLTVLSLMNIRTVNVKNNRTYSGDQAVRLVFPGKLDRNTAVCFVKQKLLKHPELPLISRYEVGFVSPFECDLILYEKQVVGCIEYMSSYMYFDKDGIIVENSLSRPETVPVIRGLVFDDISIGHPLFTDREEVFGEILNITQQLELKGIGCEEIRIGDLTDIELVLEGGDIRVRIGSNSDLPEKISVLADMLPELKSRNLRGVLDLRTYTDGSGGQVSYFREEE